MTLQSVSVCVKRPSNFYFCPHLLETKSLQCECNIVYAPLPLSQDIKFLLCFDCISGEIQMLFSSPLCDAPWYSKMKTMYVPVWTNAIQLSLDYSHGSLTQTLFSEIFKPKQKNGENEWHWHFAYQMNVCTSGICSAAPNSIYIQLSWQLRQPLSGVFIVVSVGRRRRRRFHLLLPCYVCVCAAIPFGPVIFQFFITLAGWKARQTGLSSPATTLLPGLHSCAPTVRVFVCDGYKHSNPAIRTVCVVCKRHMYSHNLR